MAQYIGVGGVARTVAAQYIGVGGVARSVAAGCLGVGGVARKIAGAGYALVNVSDYGDMIYTSTGSLAYEAPNSALPLQGNYARVRGALKFRPDSYKRIQYGQNQFNVKLPTEIRVDIDFEDVSLGEEYTMAVPLFAQGLEEKNSRWTVTGAELRVTFHESSLEAYIFYHLNYEINYPESLDFTDLLLPGTDMEGTTWCDMSGQLKFYRE